MGNSSAIPQRVGNGADMFCRRESLCHAPLPTLQSRNGARSRRHKTTGEMHAPASLQSHRAGGGDIGGAVGQRAARGAGARTALARERELLLRRRQDRFLGRRQSHGRTDVRRVHDPGAAPPPLSDRDGARRQPDRHQLHRHAGRPRRLGAVFRAPRLRRLRGRPGGARALRALVAGARSGAALAAPFRRSGASSRPSGSSNGRRRICTRNGRARASPAIPLSISSTPRSFPRS